MYYGAGAQTLNYFKIKDFKAKFDGKKWSWMRELVAESINVSAPQMNLSLMRASSDNQRQ